MPRRVVAARAAAYRARERWEAWAALGQARKIGRSHPAEVRICWDLDNTLVDSGTLLQIGRRLQDAVVDAGPVPNMLEFFESLQTALPRAEHFILSARTRSMRRDTLVWLRRHGVMPADGTVCFVPDAEAKTRIWKQLAQDARLVIVDDLSYDHESGQASLYDALAAVAEQTAAVYIGLREIAQITANSDAVAEVTARVVESLAGQT